MSDCQLPSKTFGKATVPLVGEQGPTKKLVWTPACRSELIQPRKQNSTAANINLLPGRYLSGHEQDCWWFKKSKILKMLQERMLAGPNKRHRSPRRSSSVLTPACRIQIPGHASSPCLPHFLAAHAAAARRTCCGRSPHLIAPTPYTSLLARKPACH